MKNRFAKKVDRSQSAVVKALRKIGPVIVTNMGNDFPDLLSGAYSYWKLIEVKELDGSFSRGQIEFLSTATGPVDIVTGEDDGITSVKTKRRLTPKQQTELMFWLLRNDQETIRVPKLLKLIGRC